MKRVASVPPPKRRGRNPLAKTWGFLLTHLGGRGVKRMEAGEVPVNAAAAAADNLL